MPVFIPRTRPQSMGSWFWQRFSIPVGVSIVKIGSHYAELPAPTMDDLVGVEGTDWFIGGHEYNVSDEVGQALLLDGFEVDDLQGYGYGPYGDDDYGD